MKIDHQKIEKDNVIEEYLLGKLPEDESLLFEEHMLYCADCREKCIKLERIIEAGGELAAERSELHNKKTRTLFLPVFLRVAAVLLIVCSIALLIFRIQQNKTPQNLYASDTVSAGNSNQSAETLVADTVARGPLPERNINPAGNDLLAESFIPSPVFESAVHDLYRSSGIENPVPADSSVVDFMKPVTFSWETRGNGNILFILRTNKGLIVRKEQGKPPLTFAPEKKGLYYWQLIADDEVVHTGRLLVK